MRRDYILTILAVLIGTSVPLQAEPPPGGMMMMRPEFYPLNSPCETNADDGTRRLASRAASAAVDIAHGAPLSLDSQSLPSRVVDFQNAVIECQLAQKEYLSAPPDIKPADLKKLSERYQRAVATLELRANPGFFAPENTGDGEESGIAQLANQSFEVSHLALVSDGLRDVFPLRTLLRDFYAKQLQRSISCRLLSRQHAAGVGECIAELETEKAGFEVRLAEKSAIIRPRVQRLFAFLTEWDKLETKLAELKPTMVPLENDLKNLMADAMRLGPAIKAAWDIANYYNSLGRLWFPHRDAWVIETYRLIAKMNRTQATIASVTATLNNLSKPLRQASETVNAQYDQLLVDSGLINPDFDPGFELPQRPMPRDSRGWSMFVVMGREANRRALMSVQARAVPLVFE